MIKLLKIIIPHKIKSKLKNFESQLPSKIFFFKYNFNRHFNGLLPESYKLKREEESILNWIKDGSPVPPPHIVKQKTITEYQKIYGYSTFIETGTFMGDMVEAQKNLFKKIYSIEIGAKLFKKAVRRFKRNKNVKIILGDSGKVLPEIISNINEPAIFWLDGHYSSGPTAKGDKNCPIFDELDAIFNGKISNHILLIDDARCFVGNADYPTIEKLNEYVKNKNAKYRIEVKDDIIRFVI
jgi:hypothetical protein